VIPDSCIQDGQNGTFVWVVKSNVVSVLPVKLARTYKPDSGPELAVLDGGIEPGDMVVTEGQVRLTAGARVTVIADDSLTPAT
jgi:multidrug efflux system membrane fusion protein